METPGSPLRCLSDIALHWKCFQRNFLLRFSALWFFFRNFGHKYCRIPETDSTRRADETQKMSLMSNIAYRSPFYNTPFMYNFPKYSKTFCMLPTWNILHPSPSSEKQNLIGNNNKQQRKQTLFLRQNNESTFRGQCSKYSLQNEIL